MEGIHATLGQMALRRRRILRELLPVLRKKPQPQPDLWRFASATGEVMGRRMLRAMIGTLTVAEARRMVEEKRLAALRAHLASAEAMLNGEPMAAAHAYFDVYQRAVESNRKRLSEHRWRWPWARSWRQRGL